MDAPILSGPKTLRTVLKSIEEGMRTPIPSELSQQAAEAIRWFSQGTWEATQRELRAKLRAGELTPVELVGDHQFFEGGLQRRADGVWHYYTGS